VGCTITSNVRGLSLGSYTTTADVVFSSTTNQGNTSYGWELTSCQLAFTTSNWDNWPLGTNGAGIYGSSSNLTFNGQTLSNFTSGYAILCVGGTLGLTSCTIQSNSGGVSSSATTTLTATGCTIKQNSTRGVTTSGATTLTNCTLTQNDIGLYLNGTTTANITLSNTTISSNTTDGVCLYNGTLALTSSNQSHWILTGNGVGLHADSSAYAHVL
jgi:parallel beta-helix repeat protein